MLVASTALAAWQPEGTPLSPAPVVDPSRHTQRYLRNLLPDGAGGAYVTWLYDSYFFPADVNDFAFVAQRVDVAGNHPAPWTAEGATIFAWYSSPGSFGITNANPVALVSDGAGGAVHALVSYSQAVEPHSNFNLHHVAPDATVQGFPYFTGDFAGGSTLGTAVVGDGAGGVFQAAVGQTFAPPFEPRPPAPFYARRILPGGSAPWMVDVTPPGLGTTGFSVLADGELGMYVAWVDSREAGDPDVFVQRLDATGDPAPGWPAGGMLVCGAFGPQFDTHLAPSGDGGAFVVWRDERDGTSRLYATRVHPQGGIAPGIPDDGRQVPANVFGDAFVNLAWDGQDGCFLVRAEGVARLHRLDASLEPRAGWPATGIPLHDQPAGWGHVGLAADGQGGAYVSYRNGFGIAPPQGLYAQHFAANGTIAPGWDPAGYRLSGTGGASQLVRSGSGAIVAWDDYRSAWPGIYAQRIVTDGPVAVQLALVSAVADAGRVSLHWYAPDGANLPVTIERRTEASGWSRLAALSADPSGHVRYEDAAVQPGARYAWRLAWEEADGAHTTAESWLEIPARVALAIEAPRPNPSSGEVSLAISLPEDSPARLDVLDLAGRRVASLDLALDPGRHVVALREAASLATGVYVVQLAQRGEVRRTRLLRVN